MSGLGGVELFVAGAIATGYALSALFFLRFWVRTHDAFFAAFAAAFALMSANQVVTAFSHSDRGEDARAYLLRLAAFAIIILAVLGKNAPEQVGRAD
jgi:hypothetical protein